MTPAEAINYQRLEAELQAAVSRAEFLADANRELARQLQEAQRSAAKWKRWARET